MTGASFNPKLADNPRRSYVFKLPVDLHLRVKLFCTFHKTTMSQVVEKLLQEWLERQMRDSRR